MSRPAITFLSGSLLALLLSSSLAQAAPPHDKPAHGKPPRSTSQAYSSASLLSATDLQGIRQILHQHQALLSPASSLPPGIRKNLARGKPLPPGIAKSLDQRLLRQLPEYPGYEWQQVGQDVVLIALATGLIEAVLDGLL